MQLFHVLQQSQNEIFRSNTNDSVNEELRTLPEHPSSPPVFSGVCVARSFDFCAVFRRLLVANTISTSDDVRVV